MSLVLQSSGGGQITLQEPATASNRTLTLPDITGTVASTTYVDTAVAAAPAPAALSTASGSAPSYSARAWVNFNGTGTVAISASGNVTSITDGGVGIFTVNFTTSLPDANYSVVATTSGAATGTGSIRTAAANSARDATTGSFILVVFAVDSANTFQDPVVAGVAVLR